MPIIIIEGGESTGKTSVVRALQDMIPYHTLIKLSGMPTNRYYMEERARLVAQQYDLMVPIINKFTQEKLRTLIFDRYVLSEAILNNSSYKLGNMKVFDNHAKQCGVKQFILTANNEELGRRYLARTSNNNLEKQSYKSILELNDRYKSYKDYTSIDTELIDCTGKTITEVAKLIVIKAKVQLLQITD